MKYKTETKRSSERAAPRVLVITPTYNEKENLPYLVEQIFSLHIPDMHVMVVDDNSPDGTGDVAETLSKKHPITVVHRAQKMGLGTAYKEGFRRALQDAYDYIIQMDADLSHDPRVIPQMLEQIKRCDVVLGSRYVKGGGVKNWGAVRKNISCLSNIYARVVLSLPYHDLTGGFKCYRRKVLENIDFDSLSSVGYNFQIETTYRIHQQDFHICEIPITFKERNIGKSKFNAAIILESFLKVLFLRFGGK